MKSFSNRRAAVAALVLSVSCGGAIIACTSFSSSDAPVNPTNDDAGGDSGGTLQDGSVAVSPDGSVPCDPNAPFDTIVHMDGVNSAGNEYQVRLTGDLLTAYFASDRDMPDGSPRPATNLFSATRASPTVSFAAKGVAELFTPSSADNRLSPSVTGNNANLFFVMSIDGGPAVMKEASRPNPGAALGNPTQLSISPGNANDSSVYVLPAGDVVYFSSDRSSNAGHLFVSRISGGNFQMPQPIMELNDAGTQQANPVVTADELTIYFSSLQDIYVAKRSKKDDPFGTPTPVAELNTTSNEGPSFIGPDGCDLYFFSNRSGGAGGFDLYRAHRSK